MSELYELPDGWEWKKLSDIVQIGCKKGFSPTITDGKVPFIGMSNIDEQGGRNTVFELEDFTKVSKGKVKFQKDAVLVGKITPCTQNNKVTIAPKDIDGGYATTEVYALHALEHLLPLYLNYFIRSNSINEYLVSTMIGATGRQRVPSEAIKNLDIPLPPLPEQQRIVSKLDLLFEKIDKSIALHQKNMDEANAFMESVLNDVFGELEEKYGLTILSTVVKINSGIALPSIFKDKEITDGEYEFFKVAQMNNDKKVMKNADLNFTFLQSKEYKIKLFPKGSILIPKRGGAILTNKKRILERDASYDSNVMGLKANNKILSDEFLFLFLNSIDLADYIDTTTIPQINNKHIDMMNISIPPLPIQQKVVTYLDEISQKTEKIKQLQKEKMASLGALKASILDSAFRGEL